MINRIVSGRRFTEAERIALESLRNTYHATQHVFTTEELARLHFLRWLTHSPGWNGALDRPLKPPVHETAMIRGLTWMPGSFA